MRLFYRLAESSTLGVIYEVEGLPEFCCNGMGREWGELVGFGVKGYARTSCRGVHIFTVHSQETGALLTGITEIQFCPWCGEKIEVKRVEK